MLPPDRHDVAHVHAAEQDEQLRLSYRVLLLYLLAINANGIIPDYLIQTVDEIQSG